MRARLNGLVWKPSILASCCVVLTVACGGEPIETLASSVEPGEDAITFKWSGAVHEVSVVQCEEGTFDKETCSCLGAAVVAWSFGQSSAEKFDPMAYQEAARIRGPAAYGTLPAEATTYTASREALEPGMLHVLSATRFTDCDDKSCGIEAQACQGFFPPQP